MLEVDNKSCCLAPSLFDDICTLVKGYELEVDNTSCCLASSLLILMVSLQMYLLSSTIYRLFENSYLVFA